MPRSRPQTELLPLFDAAPDYALVSATTAAFVLGRSTSSLEHARASGTGPPFRRRGRLIFYQKADILAALAALPVYQRTSEARQVPSLPGDRCTSETQKTPEAVL